MNHRAKGTFEVQVTPQEGKLFDARLGRLSLDKQFSGALVGTSKGEMLSAGSPASGSAAYVAIEVVNGILDGRSGDFILLHNGSMRRGTSQMTIKVVPDSGTGELAGISGAMQIIIEQGKHFYELEYSLDESP